MEAAAVSADEGHLRCPFCESYEVGRMYLASADLDTCECRSCGVRWDEDHTSGAYLGRATTSSVLTSRNGR